MTEVNGNDINCGRSVNVSDYLQDQTKFIGRLKYFSKVTDPRNIFVTNNTLDAAKDLVESSRLGNQPPGTTVDDVIKAKYLADSAFHADTGQRMNLIGRMSFQVPGGMVIIAALMQFYKTAPQVIFWQWVNQSNNALVNYTNRNANSPSTNKQIGVAYVSATTAAVVTSLGLNRALRSAPPLIGRFVPLVAVAAANCVNIPLMRQQELTNGVSVLDDNGNTLGLSRIAAGLGISQVCISRISIATPCMVLAPVVMEKVLEPMAWMKRIKPFHVFVQAGLCGLCLVFMVPVGCSLFPQKAAIPVSYLESELKHSIYKTNSKLSYVTFNKGL